MIVHTVLIRDASRPQGVVVGVYSSTRRAVEEAVEQALPNKLPLPTNDVHEKGPYIGSSWTYAIDEDTEIVVESHLLDDEP